MAKKGAAKKQQFPKKVAGIKLPKPLRKAGAGVVRFASTPLGSAIVADLVIASAARVIRDRQVQGASKDASREAAKFGANVLGLLASAASATAAPILAAAHNARSQPAASDTPEASPKSKRKPETEVLAEASH